MTFTVQILVQDGQVSIEWDPHTPDVARYLYDVKEVIGAAVFALNHDQDVDGRIQASYDGRVMMRERAERERAAFEADHPWVCGCGKRCKSEAGLMTHRRAGDPRCG